MAHELIITGYPEVAGYLIYFVQALIVVTVVFTFYLIWQYLKATSLVASGTNEEFERIELGGDEIE